MKKLLLVNILTVLVLHLFMITFSRITDTTELISLEFNLIFFTPLILFRVNYLLKVEEENARFWLNIIFIFIGNGVGLFLYFLNLGVTFKYGLPYHPSDNETAGISTLIYYLTIFQCIVGSILTKLLLYKKYGKRKRAISTLIK